MRIGLVCPYSVAVWGGVQQQVIGLARTLRAQGHAAQVLAPCDGIPPEPWITPLGNSMPYVQNGSIAPLAPDPPAQLRALGAIWDERFDVLHLHEPLAPGATLTTLVVKPVPLVGTFHASGEIAAYRYMRPLLRRLISRLDVSVAVSEEAAGMVNRHLNGHCDVLYNGVELESFKNATPDRATQPSVFFLARHEPRKGLATLIDASKYMPSDVIFRIGGEGPETERLKALAKNDSRFHFLGPLTDSQKQTLLKGSDAFCVPSLGGESFGIVLVEGMAAGTPVVASDIPAYRAVARDGKDATLFAAGDPKALATALNFVLEGGAEVEAIVASGRARASDFSMSSLATAYLKHYEKAAG